MKKNEKKGQETGIKLPKAGVDPATQMGVDKEDGTYNYANASVSEVKLTKTSGKEYYWLNLELEGTPLSFYSRKSVSEKLEGKEIPTAGKCQVTAGRFSAFIAI